MQFEIDEVQALSQKVYYTCELMREYCFTKQHIEEIRIVTPAVNFVTENADKLCATILSYIYDDKE